jgi:hypothetical protein
MKEIKDDERLAEFLEKLTLICDEYGYEIMAEGTPTLLYDEETGNYIDFFKSGISYKGFKWD